jgi:hypothetical protein
VEAIARKAREKLAAHMIFEDDDMADVISLSETQLQTILKTLESLKSSGRADRDEAPDFRAPLPGSPISESMCAWIALICSA